MEKVGFKLCRSLESRKVEKAERAFRGLRDRMGYVVQVGGRGRAGKVGRSTWRSSKGQLVPGPEHQRDWREKD